jgi:hypothetical protein
MARAEELLRRRSIDEDGGQKDQKAHFRAFAKIRTQQHQTHSNR